MREGVDTHDNGKHECNDNCFIGAKCAIMFNQEHDCHQYKN